MGYQEPVCIPALKLASHVHHPHQNTWQTDNTGTEDQSLLESHETCTFINVDVRISKSQNHGNVRE
jgi:hypothetical protein